MTLSFDDVRTRVLILGDVQISREYPRRPAVHEEKYTAYMHSFELDDNWVCMLEAFHDTVTFRAAHKTEQLLTGRYPNLVHLLDGIIEEHGPEYAAQIPAFAS